MREVCFGKIEKKNILGTFGQIVQEKTR